MATHRSTGSSHRSLDKGLDTRPLPTSRGGSPCMPKEFRNHRPRTSMSSPIDYSHPMSSRSQVQVPPMASMPTLMSPAPALTPGHDNKLHPMLRSTTGPDLAHPSSRRSCTPTMLSTSRSRVPTHRMENLRREPHSRYVQNFCVTDSGPEANFSPELATKLGGGKLTSRSRRSRSSRQQGLNSDVTQLPNFHLTTSYGRDHDQ